MCLCAIAVETVKRGMEYLGNITTTKILEAPMGLMLIMADFVSVTEGVSMKGENHG